MGLKSAGRASVAQGRKVRSRRRVVLPELDGDPAVFVAAGCKHGKHSNCFSLRCICECHKRCVPQGEYRWKRKAGTDASHRRER